MGWMCACGCENDDHPMNASNAAILAAGNKPRRIWNGFWKRS
jgi:hypothetical protein